MSVPKALSGAVELFRQDPVKRPDEERADDRAVDIAHAAEDNGPEDQDRKGELELARVDILERRGIERTGETGKRGAERERPEFRPVKLMPMLAAASSSSRIACQERPSRESYRRRMMKMRSSR